MNPDNPYAAPQTVESQQHAATLRWPERMASQRRSGGSPGGTRARLLSLWERSRAIMTCKLFGS